MSKEPLLARLDPTLATTGRSAGWSGWVVPRPGLVDLSGSSIGLLVWFLVLVSRISPFSLSRKVRFLFVVEEVVSSLMS